MTWGNLMAAESLDFMSDADTDALEQNMELMQGIVSYLLENRELLVCFDGGDICQVLKQLKSLQEIVQLGWIAGLAVKSIQTDSTLILHDGTEVKNLVQNKILVKFSRIQKKVVDNDPEPVRKTTHD